MSLSSSVNKPDEKISPDLVKKFRAKCEPYGRAPLTANQDRRLKNSDIRLYVAMAARVWQGNVCRLSFSELSELSTLTKRTIIDSIKRLERYGYIEAIGKKQERSVTFYVLKSIIFGQKQGREDVIVSSPRGQRYVSMDHERHGLPAREEEVA